MSTLITILIVLAAIALILIVLVQKSKGGGLASNFSSTNAVMGVRKTTDFLEKATWGLAGFIIVMSIVSVVVTPKTIGPKSEIIPVSSTPSSTEAPNMNTGTTEFPIQPIPERTTTPEQPTE